MQKELKKNCFKWNKGLPRSSTKRKTVFRKQLNTWISTNAAQDKCRLSYKFINSWHVSLTRKNLRKQQSHHFHRRWLVFSNQAQNVIVLHRMDHTLEMGPSKSRNLVQKIWARVDLSHSSVNLKVLWNQHGKLKKYRTPSLRCYHLCNKNRKHISLKTLLNKISPRLCLLQYIIMSRLDTNNPRK